MLAFVDSDRFSHFTPHFTPEELKLVRDIYLEISDEAWFDQDRKSECIHMYQRGMVDPIILKRLCMIAARDKYSVPENV